jgi:DNA (cytosine-5)-methyltransferase 1
VFVVGYLGDWRRAAAVLFERHSLSGDSAPRREKGKNLTASSRTSIERGFDIGVELTGPLSARDYKDAGTDGMNKNSAKMIPVIKQWPAEISSTLDTTFGTKQGLEDQHVNAGCPMFVPAQPITFSLQGGGHTSQNSQGSGWNKEVSFTLNRLDVHGIVQPIFFEPRSPDGVPRIYPIDGAAPTLNTMGGGQREPCVTHTIVHGTQDPCVSDIAFAQGTNNGGENVLIKTVGTDLYNGAITGEVAATMTKSMSGTGTGPTAMQAMAVRRLLPRECERLQGFPDDYTDIKPNGKQTSDGPRYKALGNSMAVPVMAWIGKRIQEVENIK